jgi:hypothetical protein
MSRPRFDPIDWEGALILALLCGHCKNKCTYEQGDFCQVYEELERDTS